MRLGYEPGRGLDRAPHRAARRADAAARRLHPQGHPDPPPRARLPVRAGAAAGAATAARSSSTTSTTTGALVPVDRPPRPQPGRASSSASSRTPTERYPEGMTPGRRARRSDPGDGLDHRGRVPPGAGGHRPRRRRSDVPIEWFALSAGAKIAMDSGSENLDWVARVLRRLVEHTQAGGEVNVVVAGINVGAQPYWNAEATMLMHTRGILVMTPGQRDGAHRQAGDRLLRRRVGRGQPRHRRLRPDHGSERRGAVLGARPGRGVRPAVRPLRADLPGAGRALAAPGRRRRTRSTATCAPPPTTSRAPTSRTVGDVFSAARQPRPQEAVRHPHADATPSIDHDHEPLERWPEMAEAETAVVCDARLGGHAVTLIGIESRPLPRHGATPGRRPGAVVGRHAVPAVVEEGGPGDQRRRAGAGRSSCWPTCPASTARRSRCAACSSSTAPRSAGRSSTSTGRSCCASVSRYHGGAFVVFSATLNDDMEVLAVEGSFASVIGGAPAAAVVFTRDVDERTGADPRVRVAEAALADATGDDAGAAAGRAGRAARGRAHREARRGGRRVRRRSTAWSGPSDVGSVHRIIAAADLRPELIAAVERGLARIDARG